MANGAGESTLPFDNTRRQKDGGQPIAHSCQRFSIPPKTLVRILQLAIAILLCKVFVSILIEYRNYFPADFEAAFLSGRRHTFVGLYRFGFYLHILTGPLTIALATYLIVNRGQGQYRAYHRIAGRLLWGLVIGLLLPSGLVMASQAYAGPIAGCGFAFLSLATAACCTLAAMSARGKNFKMHQRWATRTYLLLCSPLLLRVFTGAAIVTGLESDLTYRLNAWLSWLVPLIAYELWLRSGALVSSLLLEVTE